MLPFTYILLKEYRLNRLRTKNSIIIAMMYAGPRYKHPAQLALWKYQGSRTLDVGMKKYDGYGFKPVELLDEPKCHMRNSALVFNVLGMGPQSTQKITLPLDFQCEDSATWVIFRLSICGLTDSGPRHLPFYRRQLSIVGKIKNKPGIEVKNILKEFTDWERENIYPVLSPPMCEEMLEKLVCAGYVKIENGKAYLLKDLPER